MSWILLKDHSFRRSVIGLSALVGDHTLMSPTRHSLGKPLPYQQADKPQTNLRAINLYPCGNYLELAYLSASYARL